MILVFLDFDTAVPRLPVWGGPFIRLSVCLVGNRRLLLGRSKWAHTCDLGSGLWCQYVRLNRVRVKPFASVVPNLLLEMPWGARISPKGPKESMIRSIDHFYRSPANSWRLLCEYITTTCEYWLPRQSLSDPTGFSAPGDAQSRCNQPERPRRSILAA